jgi:PAS domain S-box-containing protein
MVEQIKPTRRKNGTATAVQASVDTANERELSRIGEERLRFLLETASIMPWEADAETAQFTFAGEQAGKMFGYPAEQWYEQDFWPLHLHPDDRDDAISYCVEHSATSDHYEFEYRMVARDGRIVWVHDLVNVLREGGKPKTISGFMIDITKRKQTEEALRDLSGLLISAQEEERRRVARELHDDLNQRMALLSIELEQLGQKISAEESALRQNVVDLRLRAQEISTAIHRLSYQLHPSQLDHLGLDTALKSFCEEFSRVHGLRIEFHRSGFPIPIPKDVTLCIFRIAQESLRNVIKHSGAESARVVLEVDETAVGLTVSDGGNGFDLDANRTRRGLGLISMSERLRLVGGELSIDSQPLQGTAIRVSVPLSRKA